MELSLFDTDYRTQRDAALAQVAGNAEAATPGFADAAEAFILAYLGRNGPTSGEAVTDACKAAGIVPHDDRAFGACYMRLSRRRLIVKVGQTVRKKGHLTSGGNVWALSA